MQGCRVFDSIIAIELIHVGGYTPARFWQLQFGAGNAIQGGSASMKAVILAGGFGSRLSEETRLKPKPMVTVGDQPILWHIMKSYGAHGIHDFIICLGYKGYVIKEYFANYALHSSDVTFDFINGSMQVHENSAEPWRVTLVDTGLETMTGGRLKRIAAYVADQTFLFTYGDAVSDLDIGKTIRFHQQHGCEATVTAVRPPSRFGRLDIDETHCVTSFAEKPEWDGDWINGGFFVLESSVIDRIDDDLTIWERAPMESLAANLQLRAYKHHGFWLPMDTLRDKQQLEELWNSGRSPWKIWRDERYDSTKPATPRKFGVASAGLLSRSNKSAA
jgi:glucose-1-phosphate cytidylyltransferase